MTKNLETADTIVKLVLAIATIILFAARVITGPLAILLVLLSIIVLTVYATRLIRKKIASNK